MTPDHFVSHAKFSPAKSSNKGHGDKNGFRAKLVPTDRWKQWRCVSIEVKLIIIILINELKIHNCFKIQLLYKR